MLLLFVLPENSGNTESDQAVIKIFYKIAKNPMLGSHEEWGNNKYWSFNLIIIRNQLYLVNTE